MSISWKRVAAGLAIMAGGIGLFFLSTFSFLAMKGQLNGETLARLPLVGSLFETEALHVERATKERQEIQLYRMERSIAWLEQELEQRQKINHEIGTLHRTDDKSMLYELETIHVNLQGAGSKRFLASRFTLGIENDDKEEAQEAFDTLVTTKSRVVILDALMRVCRGKSIEDIESDSGLEDLKKEVAKAVQDAAFSKTPGRVKDVYINEFLIQ